MKRGPRASFLSGKDPGAKGSGHKGPWPSLLPPGRTFSESFWPFAGPYLLYVLLQTVLGGTLPPVALEGVKALGCGFLLFFFRRQYRFRAEQEPGPGALPLLLTLVIAVPFLGMMWRAGVSLFEAAGGPVGGAGAAAGPELFALRVVNAVILVPVFEELFFRVYLQEFFANRGEKQSGAGLLGRFDEFPKPEVRSGIRRSVLLCALVFTVGHAPAEYLSAFLYYLATAFLHVRFRSLPLLIAVHAGVNALLLFPIPFS